MKTPAHFLRVVLAVAGLILPAQAGEKSVTMTTANAPWWSIFGDPVLDGLERQAIAAHNDLRVALARVDEARAQTRVAASALYPHLTAPLQATRQRTTDTGPIVRSRIVGGFPLPVAGLGLPTTGVPNSFAGQQATTTFSDFRAPLEISYEIDVFGRLRSGLAQARANSEATQADRDALELSLTAQVATTYFSLRALEGQSDVLRRAFGLRSEAVQIQHERVKAGAVSDLDLSRAQVEQANTEADLSDVWRERGTLRNALAVLCGQAVGDFRLRVSALGETLPEVPAGVPGELLDQRPDMREAERRLAATGAGVRIARAELWPTFNIQGQYGYESAEFNKLFDDRSRAWLISGGVHIPIFEGGLHTAQLQAAKARREQALATYRQTGLVALQEVSNALLDLRERSSQAEARARAVAQATRVLDSSQKRYQEGAVNYFEVIDAQRLLLSAQLLQVQTLQARYAATVDLIRAVGGKFAK